MSIAALHGAVTLAWVVYNLYLVQLLLRAGFDAYLAPVLLIIEGVLGAALEPLMGGISDRSRRRRLSLVAGGVLTAGIAFLAFPLTASAASGLARLLPALVLGWASAMALFRAPALSLLSRHARPQALPLAASVLTATAGLVGAAASSARAWILSFGGSPSTTSSAPPRLRPPTGRTLPDRGAPGCSSPSGPASRWPLARCSMGSPAPAPAPAHRPRRSPPPSSSGRGSPASRWGSSRSW